MQDKRKEAPLQLTKPAESRSNSELKPVPKSPVNDYKADGGSHAEVKSSIIYSQGSGSSSTPSQSLEADQEMIRKKIKAINSIKTRLQTQISHSTPDMKGNTGQFGEQNHSNSESKLYTSGQEPSLGQIMKFTEKQETISQSAAKPVDQNANSGSFQALSKGGNSEQKNPFGLRHAYSPMNSQNHNDHTSTMDGYFKKSGGTSYDAQNETHNFPGNRNSRMVNTNTTVPLPTSATQAADIESMSSDLQAAENVETRQSQANEQPRNDRLTMTDLAMVCEGQSSEPPQPNAKNEMLQVENKQLNPQGSAQPHSISQQVSLNSRAPKSNNSEISHISPAGPTQNMFSAPQFEMRAPSEGFNKQFTVHDYNRQQFQDVKGAANKEKRSNFIRQRQFNESPNLGDTKFHQTDGTNTEQLTDLQNPLENLTQTQDNDQFGQIVKKISSVRGSVTRTETVRNSATRTERDSFPRNRVAEQSSTPRGSRESLLRNQMMNHQGQGQGQGGIGASRGNSIRGNNSIQNRVSHGEAKPSQGTYSKISERSVSSFGQAFSNKESHLEQEPNAISNPNNKVPITSHAIISESPEEKIARKKTFKYPPDPNLTNQRRNSNIVPGGTVTKNVFKTPSVKHFESTGPHLDDINVQDSWPQSQPKIGQNIMTDHRMMQIGGQGLETIKKQGTDPRSSLEIQSVQTRESQFIGQETCKNLFLNEGLQDSHESSDLKLMNYQRKEDFNEPAARYRYNIKPQIPTHRVYTKKEIIKYLTKPRDLMNSPKSRPLYSPKSKQPLIPGCFIPIGDNHHQGARPASKYSTQSPTGANGGRKKGFSPQGKSPPKYVAPHHPIAKLKRSSTSSVSPKRMFSNYQNNHNVPKTNQKKLVTTNFKKQTPPSFKSGIKAMKKFNQKSREQQNSQRSGSNDDHIRVKLMNDRDNYYGRINAANLSSQSRSSDSTGPYRPSIDTWSNESVDNNKRHIWTYQDNDNKFIQIFTPPTELTKKRASQLPPSTLSHPNLQFEPSRVSNPKTLSTMTKVQPAFPPKLNLKALDQQATATVPQQAQTTRPPARRVFNSDLHSDLHSVRAKMTLSKQVPQQKPGHQQTVAHLQQPQPGPEFPTTSTTASFQNQVPPGQQQLKNNQQQYQTPISAHHQKQKRGELQRQQQQRQASSGPQPQRPAGHAEAHQRYDQQGHQPQPQQNALINSDMIESIMEKNKQIIQEQKDILGNYKANYEKLYAKYKTLKDGKYRQIKVEHKQQKLKIERLECALAEYKKEKQSEIRILSPHRQRSSSGSRSRDRSPLSQKLVISTGESKMSLQYKYDSLMQKYQLLQDKMAEQKESIVSNAETNFNDKKHDFEHHNKLKLKLYDKINDLAWRYRSKLEQGKEENANGRQIPVKDLWRWFKQMYKTWKQQNSDSQPKKAETELKKAEMEIIKDKQSAELDQIKLTKPSNSTSPKLTARCSSNDSRSRYRDDSRKKGNETHSPSSNNEQNIGSLQKILCSTLNIDNKLSYHDKKNAIVSRVEELQRLEEAPLCQGRDKEEQLRKICAILEIEGGIDGLDDFINSSQILKAKKSHIKSLSETIKDDQLNQKEISVSIVEISDKQANSEKNKSNVQQKSNVGFQNMDDTITRDKLDNLESHLKEDLAFERCWANATDQDSFLMNAPSNRHSKGSSQLLRDSQIGKQSVRELSLIKDGESKDSNSNNAPNRSANTEQNPFQIHLNATAKEKTTAEDSKSHSSTNKRSSDGQQQSPEQNKDYSSVQLARISLESQIKEEEVEESREDYDSHGQKLDTRSRITRDNLSSFIGQGVANAMDPNQCSGPPSRSSNGSDMSPASMQTANANANNADGGPKGQQQPEMS